MPTSDTEQGLSERLKKWNPMQEAYMNSQFNKYSSGPAADLGPALQAGGPRQQQQREQQQPQNQQQHQQNVPYLVFKKLPPDMGVKALGNICSKHGRVLNVRDSNKNDYIFVDLATAADQEAVYRALVNNTYGFFVSMGKNFDNNRNNHQHPYQKNQMMGAYGGLPHHHNNEQLPAVSRGKNAVDTNSRSYRSSDRNPPRPYFQQTPIVSAQQYAAKNSLLQRNDPQRHFLIENDAHDLERAGYQHGAQTTLFNNDKCNYRTGRAYINMPAKMEDFINTKHKESQGTYNTMQNCYQYAPQHAKQPSRISKCAECERPCDFVCCRCITAYCGVECQKKAWPKHRYVCGKPEHLQKSPGESFDNYYASGMNNVKSINVTTAMANFGPEAHSDTLTNLDTTNMNAKAPLASTSKASLAQNMFTNKDAIVETQFASKSNSTLNVSAASKSMSDDTSSLPSSSKAHTTLSPPAKPVSETHMPRSGSLVTLTSISKTNVVFIRSKTYEDNMSFFKVITEIQAAVKTMHKLVAPPRCGQIVVGCFEGQYNRAMVLNTDNLKRINLVFVDFGNLDAQPMDQLYEAPEHYVSLPRFAIPVILKHVPNSYMTAEISKFMHSYLDGIDLELRYKAEEDYLADKGVYCVELIDEATNKSLNKMIASLSKPIEPSDIQEAYHRDYLRQQLLPAGENIELVVMDNSLFSTGCISCSTKEYATEIQKFQKDLQLYAEALSAQSYAPRIDELCIAKYSEDQKWYRGRCLDLVGDGHPTIVFFDYGNIAYVSVKNIRRYPSQFTFPIYTSDCEIADLPDHCNEALIARLEQLIPNGSTISCARVMVYEEDQFHSISLPKIIDKLKEESLLEQPEAHV